MIFSDRFQDFEKISPTLRLVAFPHLVEAETAPLHVQMELIELKNDEQLLKKFRRQKDFLEIWKDAFQYPNMQLLARETLVLFGSTYVCEAAFSSMKYLKNSYRTRFWTKILKLNCDSWFLVRYQTFKVYLRTYKIKAVTNKYVYNLFE